jgi:glutamate dehydrogenase (NADP+)
MLKRHGLGFEGLAWRFPAPATWRNTPLRKRWSLARVITASDSNGTVVDEAGFTKEKLARLIDIKEPRRPRGRLRPRIWPDLP